MEQQTKEWLEFRQSHIGSSDISSILGLNPWKSAYELWLEKLGKKDSFLISSAMKRGINLEEEARQAYINFSGNVVLPSICTLKDWPIGMASLDGVNETGKIICEIKCPSFKTFEEALNGTVPPYYFCQIQWQLLVSKAEQCDYFCYIGKDKYTTLACFPNKKYQDLLLKKAKEFWENVKNKIPPVTTESDYILIEDENFKKFATEYKKVIDEIKKLEKEKNTIKTQLLDFGDDGNMRGEGLKIKRCTRKTINWEKVCKKYNISKNDLQQFTEEGKFFWTISIN
jgi:putative phage-type endonuclease